MLLSANMELLLPDSVRIIDIENIIEYPDVPRGTWPYEAMQKLAAAGIIEWNEGSYMGNTTMTRYHFAVTVAQLLQKIDQAEKQKLAAQQRPPGTPLFEPDKEFLKAIEREENKLLIQKLKEEFQPDFNALKRRAGSNPSFLRSTTTPRPHYVYLHLNFAYGTDIDPRLVADTKALIESYCAATLKAQTKAQQ